MSAGHSVAGRCELLGKEIEMLCVCGSAPIRKDDIVGLAPPHVYAPSFIMRE